MEQVKKYHAFISYSHKDKPYASAIQKSIETLGLPFYKSWQPDVNIFRDERKIPLAGSLTEQIISGLKESEYLIVIASKNSANSRWVREEILNWHRENKDENGYITNFNFILTDDIIEWDYLNHDFDKLKTTALPSFDKRIFKEVPLWANLQLYCKNGKVQSNNSNYEWEIAKIKGLLLEKKPDEIIDEVSKSKRFFRIIVGFVISALIALSAFAFYSRGEAISSKEIAIQQRNIAQSNYLLSEAKSANEKDPSLALRLLEAAMKINPNPVIDEAALKIYRQNSFYRIIYNKDTFINALVFSPDKEKILIASMNSAFQLCDLNGTVIQEFRGHASGITSAVFSSTGDTILTGSSDSTACLWNLSGKLLQKFKGHTGSITSVAFSPNGKYVLTGSNDLTARLWDLRGNTFKVFKGHSNKITSVAFSGDQKILTSSWDKTARLWDLGDNDQLDNTSFIKFPSNAFFLPSGKTIIHFSKNSATLCDLSGKIIQEFKDTSEYIIKVAVSPDEKAILTWYNNSARIWDINGTVLKKFSDDSKYIQSLQFSPDGKTILACYQRNARLWNLKGDILQEFVSPDNYHFSYAGFTYDSKKIYTLSGYNTLRLWRIKSVKEFECPAVSSLAFSPNGNEILAGSWDKKARLFDSKGNLIQEFRGHTDGITSIAFSPTGDKILTGSNDSTAYLWNKKGDNIQVFKGHSGKILSVAFSPDGRKILTGSNDMTARLWDLNGNTLNEFKYSSFVTCVTFSPDNKWILLAGANGVSQLINIKINSIKEFKLHSEYITSASFSPDGKTILTGSLDYTVHLWNLKGETIQLIRLDNAPTSVAFSRDGYSILSSAGSKACLWDMSGNMIQEFNSYSGPIVSGTFSADGKRILTGSTMDKSARLWEIPLPLKSFLESDDIESLTTEQKKQFNLKL